MDAATTPTTPSQDAFLLIYCTHRFPPTLFGDYRLDPNLLNAPFLKYGKQRCASGTAAVWEDDPTPTGWLSGLAAGWRPSLPGRPHIRRQSPLRLAPAAGKAATTPRSGSAMPHPSG